VTARERILATASRLFCAHGTGNVGVDRIVADSGIAKATLYAHFPSKEDLVLAYLDQVNAAWRGQLERAAAAAGDDPRQRLVGVFGALTEACKNKDFHSCAFINVAAETESGTRVRAAVVAHKRGVRRWLQDLATAAAAPDPPQLARSLSLLIDGCLASGRTGSSAQLAAAAKSAAAVLVDAACPDSHRKPRRRRAS
jgi:AcrR family transcriptional regulator